MDVLSMSQMLLDLAKLAALPNSDVGFCLQPLNTQYGGLEEAMLTFSLRWHTFMLFSPHNLFFQVLVTISAILTAISISRNNLAGVASFT